MAGPLRGLRVLEFAGLGPAPFACMLLSDMGAEVVCVDRPQARLGDARNVMQRGRTVVQADLKSPEGRGQAAELAARADVLVEGFRPGVMERLGLGPEALHERNPGLVYGRNIIQHDNPAGMTRALMAMLHDGASATRALEILRA